MTQRNPDLMCGRCGTRRPGGEGGSRLLCGVCHGTCRTCGAPAALTPAGNFRTYCSKCRRQAETKENCTKCGRRRDGSHQSYCRACYREYDKANRDPAKVAVHQRRSVLKRSYNLTEADFGSLLASQGGGCAICGAAVGDSRTQLHVDHDHGCCPGSRTCGKCIRGLLCSDCNRGLGVFEDDPALLRKAAEYLESSYSSS